MNIRNITIAALVASSVVALPVAAEAAKANSAAVTKSTVVRKNASHMVGGSGTILAVLAAAGVIAGIALASDSNKAKSPG